MKETNPPWRSEEDALWDSIAQDTKRRSSGGAKQKLERILSKLFPQQRAFVEDRARNKALLCPRRAGKTIGCALHLLRDGYFHRGDESLYITNTRDQAKKILWDELKVLDDELELGIRWNNSDLVAYLDNTTKISLAGADTQADIDRFRGRKYRTVIIDECASFRPSILDPLISRAVMPALNDLSGTMAITGSPGHILHGLFYEATGPHATEVKDGKAVSRPFSEKDSREWKDVDWRWSLHAWTVKDNITRPDLWKNTLETKRLMGWSDEHPTWIREGLGRWATDDTYLVYRYHPDRNLWEPGKRTKANPFGLPEGHEWRYILGADMGFHDPFCLQVFAHSDTDKNLYQVYEYLETKLSPREIAAKYTEVLNLIGWDKVDYMIADWSGLGEGVQKQFAEEYSLSIEAADRRDKRDHIELMNGDLVDGRLKLLPDSELVNEMLYLSWDDSRLKEKSGQANHASDASCYVWRLARHHYAGNPPVPLVVGSPEWEKARSDEEDRVLERYEKVKQEDDWEDEPEDSGDGW